MMNSMNSWIQEKRQTYQGSRSSSVGDLYGKSKEDGNSAAAAASGSSSKRITAKSGKGSGSSSKSKSKSKSKSSSSSSNKRKGRRPNQSKREQEEARLTRVQLEMTDDSDYQDSDQNIDYDPNGSSNIEYDEEEIIEDSDCSDAEDDDDDDAGSVYTTITVETTRTKENENRKPLGPFSGYFGGKKEVEKASTQIMVMEKDPVRDLEKAMNDITKLSICMKDVHVDQDVAQSFLKLMRGDGRSWEAIAVDILRQKARWESIVIEECSSSNDSENIQTDANEEYLNMLLAHILAVDNCAYLHLSNFVWNAHTAWTMQALMFSKSLQKLQLDLIDLTFAIPMMRRGLENNTSMTCLIASRCGLDDDALGDLLGHLPKQLEELRIFGNKCRAKGLEAITTEVSRKDTCLKLLDLSYQHVGPNEEFDIQWLADAIRRNTVLKTLDLDNDSIDDGHLTHIVAALTKNRTLEELMLNHNKITGTGVAMLASKFGDMKGLKKISMYSNVFDAATTSTSASAVSASKNANPTAMSNGK
ncbi:MAG: hypothetical protein SGILL_008466 [Bacillariaceae sp.]